MMARVTSRGQREEAAMETIDSHRSAKARLLTQELLLDSSVVVRAKEQPRNSSLGATTFEPLDTTTPVGRRAIRLEAQVAVGLGGV